MINRVWIIGSGVWAGKIESSLLTYSKFSVIKVGAREFEAIYKNIKSNDLVWIASRPEVQISILQKFLEQYPGYIILEKPYGLSKRDLTYLKSLIGTKDNVFLSTPWLYSSLWRSAMELISSNKIIELHGKRVGPVKRPYCSSVEDRLPHDLYMLQYLKENSSLEASQLSFLNSTKSELGFLATDNKLVQIEIGHSETLVAFWKITISTGFILVNFDTHHIFAEGRWLSHHSSRDKPLTQMLEKMITGERFLHNQVGLIDTMLELSV